MGDGPARRFRDVRDRRDATPAEGRIDDASRVVEHGNRLEQPLQRNDDIDLGQLIEPSPPDREADGQFEHTGPVWWVGLTDAQTHALVGVLGAGGSALAGLAGPLWPAVAAALLASIGYIEAINKAGGNHGVDINGVIGTQGIIVTPRVGKVYGALIQAGRLSVSGRTILEFVLYASSKIPPLAEVLKIPVAANVFGSFMAGTPLGWALCAGLGLAVHLLEPEPDPNEHGAVTADRDQALEWESFMLAHLGPGNDVTLLSWQGLFSAQSGGGRGVYANRPQVGDWERWKLIENGDGTVSLQTVGGHYLCAEEGGGRECQADRTAIGNWEKFFLVPLPDGKFALKTRDKGKFVSVQP